LNIRLAKSIWAKHSPKYVVRFAIVAFSYAIAMLLTQAIPFNGSGLSPVWFPTGVALFLLTWWSPNLWPAVFLAGIALDKEPFAAIPLLMCLLNALEPAVAAYLYLRIFKNRERLADLNGSVTLLALGGLVTPMLGGWVVRGIQSVLHLATFDPEAKNLWLWVGGDLNGTLLLTPVLIGFAFWPTEKRLDRKKLLEFATAFAILILVTGLVFDSWERLSPALDLGDEVIGQSFLILPLLAWIAIRFCGSCASLSFLGAMLMGIFQTVNGRGPYAGNGDRNILWLHAFIAIAGTFVTVIIAGKRERDRSLDALLESQERYRFLFENNPQPMWVYDTETLRFSNVNEAAIKKYGYSSEDYRTMTIRDIRPAEAVPALLEEVANPDPNTKEWRHLRKDGGVLDVEVTSTAFHRDGRLMRLVLANDITPRKILEAELRQAQKLEALGRLAGGVAHDFNNLIMIISSCAELIQQQVGRPEKVETNSERILQATTRAAALTRQLLAFSRQQVLSPEVVDLNATLADMLGLVRRLLGEGIELQFSADSTPWPVRVDLGQITQVVLNLCANARDAMDGKGRVTISTGTFEFAQDMVYATGIIPAGTYSTFSVRDSGSGMSRELQEHIFEPFFTTKERGKGTGLGLATVYGIIQQSSGYIRVQSEAGQGSDFTVFLPRVLESPVAAETRQASVVERGDESILVVEDEHELRATVVESLRNAGYRVVHAVDGQHALHVAKELRFLDVLVTDVVMPNMGGPELVPLLRKRFPELKVIFMSGYADGLVSPELLDERTIFSPKPLSLSALARQIRSLVINEAESCL
jgi:two-component system, cell cycle sensor histidine kinase and response regulator CckA